MMWCGWTFGCLNLRCFILFCFVCQWSWSLNDEWTVWRKHLLPLIWKTTQPRHSAFWHSRMSRLLKESNVPYFVPRETLFITLKIHGKLFFIHNFQLLLTRCCSEYQKWSTPGRPFPIFLCSNHPNAKPQGSKCKSVNSTGVTMKWKDMTWKDMTKQGPLNRQSSLWTAVWAMVTAVNHFKKPTW